MATKFRHDQHFAGDPVSVMAMLKDPDYVALKCDRTGSMETTVDIQGTADGGCLLVTKRVLPAKVPAAAKRFVGETISVTETQTWTPPSPDGSATATGEVEFNAPLSFSATITLSPNADGTLVRTEGSFKASIPFVGGTIESSAADITTKYLVVEETVGNEWLAR